MPRRVWGGTALLIAGRVWGSACTLAYLYLLAWHLPGEDFGRLTFYLALFLVLDSLVDLGTGHTAVQWTAADPERMGGVLSAARRVRLASALLGVALVGGGALVAREPGAGWILLASLYPLTHALELTTTVFKNAISWGRPVLVRALASGLSLGFVLALWWRGVSEPALFLVAVALGSALGNVLLHLVGRHRLPAAGGPTVAVRPLLRAALPLGIAGLCQQAYFWIDNLFVRPLAGDVELGRYNLVVRLMSFGIMAAVYATLAALPWLTREQRAGRLGPASARLAQPMLALAGLATGLAWPWCEWILSFFGEGDAFVPAAPSLRWLLLATLVVYVGAVLVTGVVAVGRPRAVLAISATGLAVNVVGNALLVPGMGSEGAAIATLATELAVALSAAVVLARAGVRPFSGKRAVLWALGPILFLLARWLSAALPL